MSDSDGTGRLGYRPRTESLAAPLFGRAPAESAQTRARGTPPAPPPTPTRRAASACRAKRCARLRRGPAPVHCRRMRRGPTAAAVGCLLSSCCRHYPPVTPTRRRVGSRESGRWVALKIESMKRLQVGTDPFVFTIISGQPVGSCDARGLALRLPHHLCC
jgi:hypothetical protein